MSLTQLMLADHPSPEGCFLYRLARQSTLEYFQNVVLLSSSQDRYVPFHSARIEICAEALRDSKNGTPGDLVADRMMLYSVCLLNGLKRCLLFLVSLLISDACVCVYVSRPVSY